MAAWQGCHGTQGLKGVPWSFSAGEGNPHHYEQGLALITCGAGEGASCQEEREQPCRRRSCLILQEGSKQRVHEPVILRGCWSPSKRNGPKERQLGLLSAQSQCPISEGKPEALLAIPCLRSHRWEELGNFVAQVACVPLHPAPQHSCPFLGWGMSSSLFPLPSDLSPPTPLGTQSSSHMATLWIWAR